MHYRFKKQLKIVQAMKTKYLLQVTMKVFLNVTKKLLLVVTTLMQNPSLILLLQVKILLILLFMMTVGDLQISVQMLLKGVVAQL